MCLTALVAICGELLVGTGIISAPRICFVSLRKLLNKTKDTSESVAALTAYSVGAEEKFKKEIKEYEKLYGEIKFVDDDTIKKEEKDVELKEALVNFFEECDGDIEKMKMKLQDLKIKLEEDRISNESSKITLIKNKNKRVKKTNKK